MFLLFHNLAGIQSLLNIFPASASCLFKALLRTEVIVAAMNANDQVIIHSKIIGRLCYQIYQIKL